MNAGRPLGMLLAIGLLTGACGAGASQPAAIASATPTPEPTASPEPTPSPTPEPEPFSDRHLGRFRRPKAMAHVRKLAGEIGIRVRTTEGERLGARYIRKRFEAYGYRTDVQTFDVDSGTSRNVVAWWPGSGRNSRHGLVLGGHMDSVPGSPGANDNASGVAVVLELARIAAGKAQSRWVRFIAFGSEEYGTDGTHHAGSRTYVAKLGKKGRARLAGMISVDMIADGRPLLIGSSGIAGDALAGRLFNRVRRAGIATEYRTFCDCSDNGPFEHAGVPGALVWSGPDVNYHSPSDTVGNMKPDDLRRTGRAVRAFLRRVNRALIQALRRA